VPQGSAGWCNLGETRTPKDGGEVAGREVHSCDNNREEEQPNEAWYPRTSMSRANFLPWLKLFVIRYA
jgi:hypothetical protein